MRDTSVRNIYTTIKFTIQFRHLKSYISLSDLFLKSSFALFRSYKSHFDLKVTDVAYCELSVQAVY